MIAKWNYLYFEFKSSLFNDENIKINIPNTIVINPIILVEGKCSPKIKYPLIILIMR
jgi:hypothetical protein